ncbi:MAG: mechanosensitive ion channel [Actinobacteria bacterium]|jgi:small-conductance mechanosensitive channel|nr:MAG: mechanosensitive ion channel [Actinomycetota bacterium]
MGESRAVLLLADGQSDLIAALITMGVAILIALAVDRLVIARGTRVASRMADTTLSRTTRTRLRLIRRLVFVIILAIGAALALSRFHQFSRLATGILASSAVLGLVIGFAARQTLANMVAGILLAITQPIRIGDTVSIAGSTGRVDDLTLSYTYIDTGDGRLLVVPNEQVVSSPVFNHSTGDRTAPATVSVWLPPPASLDEARRVLKPAGATEISVAEITPDGIRLELKGSRDRERTQVGDEESDLREHAQNALRAAGLLEEWHPPER